MKVVASATHGTGKPAPSQFGLINLLKAVAAQLIVLHHLAFYGPMADHARALFPALIDWLSSSARIAVQVFLVVGGFLAAKSLAPSGHAGYADPLRAIWRRYTKLAPAFLAATLIAAVASTLAAQWMSHDSISPPATLAQLSAHAAAAWRCSISAGVVCGHRLPAVCADGGGAVGGRHRRGQAPAGVADAAGGGVRHHAVAAVL
jgi:peptidoglycan/LPS O-acetylase OafA/YrhL